MKNFAVLGLLFLCSCAGASIATVSEIMTEGWKIIKPHSQDTITVIRTYKNDNVTAECGRDTVIVLSSQDKLLIRWLGNRAIISTIMENDTVKIAK